MKHHGDGPVTIPPQPDPAVQETTFAADSRAELDVLEPEAIPDQQQRDAELASPRDGDYGPFPDDDRRQGRQDSKPGSSKSSARALAPDLLRGLLMVLMAMDHNSLGLRSWPHGTAIDGEVDSGVVHEWNRPIAYVIRTLTHLCAPGFTFLLGMGVVYFGQSRTNLGWSTARMLRHFLTRFFVLTLVTEVMGLGITMGQVWFFNIVLFALAFDYLVAGLLWLAVASSEQTLASLLLKVLPEQKDDDAAEPLLQSREGEVDGVAPDRTIIRAADISWHLHNAVLLGLSFATIWWNHWFSPTNGDCGVEPVPKLPNSNWYRLWFYFIEGPHVLSGFPPLAWLSFAILGLLYGRIILARSWTAKVILTGNAFAAVGFFLLFAMTRVFRFGNLSEGCLQMPEHTKAPNSNQYLTSVPSFFYITKYPPDVAFWSFTMAGNFLFLALFGAIPARFATRLFKVLLVFGTSALFFYVLHIPLLFSIGGFVRARFGHTMNFKEPFGDGLAFGVDNLWAYFGHLALALGILYPLCRWYGGFKQTKSPDSLWRFF
ncbi:hypothetical protein B0H63DRAFT_457974 [Podospora didyma]|uniref:Heparan-alpha-glucosaminide N-acetyltransferase catalytic domain-containing protein n=1 Tax=Podospora didyma TaxID=330526 RepID=A0AAE0P4T1_9PEZI|nr:hypothetical protein B0H63DRAFT_457974 [Podospora didyma]